MASTLKEKKKKPATPRYGIAEWYGKPIVQLSVDERKHYSGKAQLSITEAAVECPFRTELFGRTMPCNKAGGVCSIAKYATDADATSAEKTTVSSELACLCPSRLLDREVFKRIGKAVLGSEDVYLVREVPFLQNAIAKEPGKSSKAGRIDFVLVDKANPANWCAVETQAVYFSGDAMDEEFQVFAGLNGPLTAPVGQRRPDYRSSVPKRLSPQLMLKVPHLGKGKYLAVVVDGFVRSQMAHLEEVTLSEELTDVEEHRQEKLALAEVIWFIVKLAPGEPATISAEHYATLAQSIKALDSALPIPSNRFSKGLKELINDPSQRGEKVIQLF